MVDGWMRNGVPYSGYGHKTKGKRAVMKQPVVAGHIMV
jgi:hypothetical protein